MENVIISADSTCDLSEELKARYKVRYQPYHIEYRNRDYLDGVDIVSEDLYEGYYADGSLPKTAAVNVREYVDYFKSLTKDGAQVIHFNLGSALSSSHEHACLAACEVPGVFVVDSCNLSTGTGQLVIRAARLLEGGASAEDTFGVIKAMRSRVHTSFVLDTLEFMAAGGRCPQIVSQVGEALRLRPEIVVDNADGSMRVGRLHHGSMRKAVKEYIHNQLKHHEGVLLDDVFVTHSGATDPELVDTAIAELREQLPGLECIHVTRASCTISSHCGPGCLGIIFVTES